jgi:diacylglycerol kinase family enzyme
MIQPRQWLIIFNPDAGYLSSNHYKECLIKRILREIHSQVVFTRYAGHATEIVRHSWDYDRIGVFGGDGTVSEVINGMNLDRQRLLIFPGGRSNGVARDLGIRSLEMAFAAEKMDRCQGLDLVGVDFRCQHNSFSRIMVSTASIGYGADVVKLANQFRNPLGAYGYWVAAFLRAQSFRLPQFCAQIESEDCHLASGPYSSLVINNLSHIGNLPVFKRADIHDGRFEISLIKPVLGLFILLRFINLAGTTSSSWSDEQQARHLSIGLKTPRSLVVDGKLWDNIIQAEFHIHEKKLVCLA